MQRTLILRVLHIWQPREGLPQYTILIPVDKCPALMELQSYRLCKDNDTVRSINQGTVVDIKWCRNGWIKYSLFFEIVETAPH